MNQRKLTQRFQFLVPTIVKDSLGGEVLSWEAGTEYWCDVERLRGRSDEQYIADRITAVTAARLTMRYVDVDPKWRVLYDGVWWEIESVLPDTKQKWLELEILQVTTET